MEGIAIAKLLLIFARYLSNALKKKKWAKTETLWSIRKSLFCNPRSYLVWHHNICTLPNLFFESESIHLEQGDSIQYHHNVDTLDWIAVIELN